MDRHRKKHKYKERGRELNILCRSNYMWYLSSLWCPHGVQNYPLAGATISDRATYRGRVRGIYCFTFYFIICGSNYIGHPSSLWCPHGVRNYLLDGTIISDRAKHRGRWYPGKYSSLRIFIQIKLNICFSPVMGSILHRVKYFIV